MLFEWSVLTSNFEVLSSCCAHLANIPVICSVSSPHPVGNVTLLGHVNALAHIGYKLLYPCACCIDYIQYELVFSKREKWCCHNKNQEQVGAKAIQALEV